MNAEIRMGSPQGIEDKPKKKRLMTEIDGLLMEVEGPHPLHLSPRDRDLMRELVRGDGGDDNRLIAFRLGITEGSIKVYLTRLMAKTNLRTRTALALYAERCGLFKGN